jgi:hypothetical protein
MAKNLKSVGGPSKLKAPKKRPKHKGISSSMETNKFVSKAGTKAGYVRHVGLP